MPPVNETTRTAEWLYNILKADAGLVAKLGGAADPRIHEDVAPQASPYPVVIIGLLAPVDYDAHNVARIMTKDLWMVKGIARSDPSTAGASMGSYMGDLKIIADRIEAVLHLSNGGVAGDGTIFTSVRERTLRYSEVDDGVHYRHLGGEYRIYTQVP